MKQPAKSKRSGGLWLGSCLLAVFLLAGVYWYPPEFLKKWVRVKQVKTLLKESWERFYGLPGSPVPWPEGHQVRGIDVSRYQTHVAWPQVKAGGIDFAFIKATEGFYRQDELFAAHWEAAGAAGIYRGAYHFFRPGQPAMLQALNFTRVVSLAPGDLPPVLDVEVLGDATPAELREKVQEWLDQVEDKYEVKPIIYTNYDFYRLYLAGYFDEYPLWIAHYQVPRLRIKPGPKRKLRFWQLTDRGQVAGIQGRVDCNVFYGSLAELKALTIAH